MQNQDKATTPPPPPPKEVHVTKVAGSPGSSQEIGYWVRGLMSRDPKVGQSLTVLRTCRNGVDAMGIFQTTPIKALHHIDPWRTIVTTENSTWLLEYVGEYAAEVLQ